LQSGGEFLSFPEELAPAAASLVALEQAVRIGPAASIAIGGFFQALVEGHVKHGDVVLINIGEGIRRDPSFILKMIHSSIRVNTVEDCPLRHRRGYRDFLYQSIMTKFSNISHIQSKNKSRQPSTIRPHKGVSAATHMSRYEGLSHRRTQLKT
jgi:hypothetical protein